MHVERVETAKIEKQYNIDYKKNLPRVNKKRKRKWTNMST